MRWSSSTLGTATLLCPVVDVVGFVGVRFALFRYTLFHLDRRVAGKPHARFRLLFGSHLHEFDVVFRSVLDGDGDLGIGIVQVAEMYGIGGTGRCASRLHPFIDAVIAVVALDGLFGDRVQVDRAVGTNLDTAPMPAASVVIDRDGTSRVLVYRAAGTGLDTWRVFTMLARHRQKHPGDFGILADVLVNCLPYEVSEWNVILGFAGDFAAMTAKAPAGINKPAILLAIVRCQHSIVPTFLRLVQRVLSGRILFSFGLAQSTECHKCYRAGAEELSTVGFLMGHRLGLTARGIATAYDYMKFIRTILHPSEDEIMPQVDPSNKRRSATCFCDITHAMELKHLQTFITAFEQASFTSAGNSLGITQAAVSQHVAALELELAAELFERAHRAITPTESGQRLYEYANRILDLVADAKVAVRGDELPVQGELRVAASTVPAESLLPCLVARVRTLFPGIHESITVTDSQSATAAVASGDADVGFVGEQTASSKLDFQAIADDELLLVVSPLHEWVGKQFIAPRSLAQQPLILREAGSGSRHCIESALRAKGVELQQLNVAMVVNSNDAIRAAVEQNAGIAFLSATTVNNDLQQGRLVQVGVRGVKPSRQLYLVTRRGAAPSRVVSEFIQFVLAARCS